MSWYVGEPSSVELGRFMSDVHKELNEGQEVELYHNNVGFLGYTFKYKNCRGKVYQHDYHFPDPYTYSVCIPSHGSFINSGELKDLDEVRAFIKEAVK